ncbi:MAG: DUF72 domain-containing protein [Actinomycetota bacterium]|nr:DUF72 domain-containing protein [Actinomycetota bacterium]
MASNLERLSVGTSGWSYPSWRPEFYPAGLANEDFLSFYAQRLPSVELNSTGYRLPSEEQFAKWAAAVPDGFRFAVKMPPRALRALGTFEERVLRLGDRLGPVRVVVQTPRDDGLLALLLGSTGLRLALDLRHETWAGVEIAPAVRVNDWETDAPFRYLRFREPPFSDADLRALAARIQLLLADGIDVFAYFRHEDAPTAPAYAETLIALVSGYTLPR